jgi:hypothetical protein
MNVASSSASAARRTELDPFDSRVTTAATEPTREARGPAEAEFGCVDWYQYQTRADQGNDALKKFRAAQ